MIEVDLRFRALEMKLVTRFGNDDTLTFESVNNRAMGETFSSLLATWNTLNLYPSNPAETSFDIIYNMGNGYNPDHSLLPALRGGAFYETLNILGNKMGADEPVRVDGVMEYEGQYTLCWAAFFLPLNDPEWPGYLNELYSRSDNVIAHVDGSTINLPEDFVMN